MYRSICRIHAHASRAHTPCIASNFKAPQVRQFLIEARESIDKSMQAKKQRELKKFGKQVQQQVRSARG